MIPPGDLKKNVPGIDALFCLLTDQINKEVLDAAGPQLKIVATMSVGFEHIDLPACAAKNIVVTNTPFVSTEAVAELTLTLLLCVARRVRESENAVKNGEWGPWKPMWLCGPTLEDATVGILGLGRIGFAIAERVRPFKISRLLYNDVVKNEHAPKVGAEFVDMDTLLKESDFVITMSPLNESTKGMFNKALFKKMKNSAVFINTSRGGVVNEADLCEALNNKEIGGAGLDVTEPEPMATSNPLLKCVNCVVLPHAGSNTMVARNKMSKMAAENILAVLQGKPPVSPVK
jgi:glyoxylate/hydroxypyruvate reductase